MASKIEYRDGVIYNIDYGTDTGDEAAAVIDEIMAVMAEHGLTKAPLLVDLRESTGVSPEARRVYGDAVANDALERIGFVTDSTFMRVAVNFVTRASGKAEKTRFFPTVEDAHAWLAS